MKKINEYKPHSSYLTGNEGCRGNPNVNGNNFCNESVHGTKDFGGTKYGFLVRVDSIYWGNNTLFLGWPSFVDRWIEDPMSGTGILTSHWGKGTSKETSFKDGIPEYQLAWDSINDIYLIRIWEGVADMSQKKFKANRAVRKLASIGLVIKEYELTKEEYMSYVPDDFDFVPTHLNKIRRFVNSQEKYIPKKLINSIDLTTMFSSGQLHDTENTVWVKVLDSPKMYSKQRHLPVIGNDNMLVSKLRQLPVLDTVNVNGATIEVRVGKRPKREDVDPTKSNRLKDLKELGYGIYPLSNLIRGTRPLIMWTDSEDVVLPVYDAYTMLASYCTETYGTAKDRDLCLDTICILKVVEPGDLEFNTIKSSKPSKEMQRIGCEAHMNVILNNPDLQFISEKETARVKLFREHLVSNGSYRAGLIVSLRELSDKTLTEDDLDVMENHELTQSYSKRNLDWLISPNKSKNAILHLEFSLKGEDYKHEDQFFRKVGYDLAPYHVWVLGDFESTNSKRKHLMEDLKDRQPNSNVEKVWVVQVEDLMKGNTKNFKLLWERK